MNDADKFKLADVIGQWYADWRYKITDNGVTHRLGYAKEELKQKIEQAFSDDVCECQEPNCTRTATKDWNGRKVCDDCHNRYKENLENQYKDLE